MKVAEVTYDQAAALDPATLQPGQAIAVRFGTVRAIIGPLVGTDAPVPMLVGELRFDDDRPLGFFRQQGGHEPGLDAVRADVATPEGLRGLLRWLERIATVGKLASVSPTKTGATA